jgi:cephalosporin hydroxylase
MNELEQYFEANQNRLMNKWQHYFDIYDRYFHPYKGKSVTIVEIGCFHGGSLQMWKHYFGDQAIIWGIDIDPRCKTLEEENINVLIGSQEDRNFLASAIEKIGEIDILIDDGGHTQNQQKVSFEMLFDAVKPNGIYLCEDTHTSYINAYGGGYHRRGSFTEYVKNLIDQINAYHSEQKNFSVDSFTKTANSIHFYDSVIVIEKKKRNAPTVKKTGKPSFVDAQIKKTFAEKVLYHFLLLTNGILQKLGLPGYMVNKMLELSSKL